MLKTLFSKLTISLIILLIVVGLFYVFANNIATNRYIQQVNLALNRQLAKNIVEDRQLVKNGELNEKALKEIFRQYMIVNPSLEFYMLDLTGKILSYSADSGVVKRKSVSLKPIYDFLNAETPYPVLGDDPRSYDRQKAFSVTPVPSMDNPQNYLYVVLRGQQFDAVENVVRGQYLWQISLWVMFGSLLFGLIIGVIIFHLLTRRLHHLSQLMSNFKSCEPSQLLYTPSNTMDEIEQLGLSFNRMSQRIGKQFEQLEEQDHLRRQLIAHVSHDLRTPLASMQGFLETLQNKSEQLSLDERQEYLAVAVKQGNHLNKMINELFELSSLDAKEKEVILEPFSALELVYDIIQKYQIQAQQKQINLTITREAEIPFVNADIRLVERILDNLLNNALDYTPKKGQVDIQLCHIRNKVQFKVRDNGAGMATETLEHLFEPFYRQEQGEIGKKHAGLGLAIAKKMSDLLDADLKVKSILGKGTIFIFSLGVFSD